MSLLDWIFPRECIQCSKSGSYLCAECKKTLSAHPELCPACHKRNSGFKLCPSCVFTEKWYFDGLIVGFAYEKWIKKLILKLKFYHKKDLGDFLAERLSLHILTNQYLLDAVEAKSLYLTWVPSHWIRHYIQKGYNQSKVLAQQLAKKLDLPLIQSAKKKKATQSQVKLNRDQRIKNLSQVFRSHDLLKLPQNAKILIVDDVTTTGATINEMAKTLKSQRPDLSVWGIVIARHI